MILIVGASGGIGAYLYERYSALGEHVAGTCHEHARDGLTRVDVTSYDEVRRWVESETAGAEDGITLILCAAINYNSFAHKADPEAWKRVIEVNLLGGFWAASCALKKMREMNFGRIIFFSSVVAQAGVPGTSAYAASKAALWGLTRALAKENGSKGITVNTINLGYADIGMGKNEIDGEARAKIEEKVPSRRFCEPEEIYLTVQYIRENGYLNGTGVDLNGALI